MVWQEARSRKLCRACLLITKSEYTDILAATNMPWWHRKKTKTLHVWTKICRHYGAGIKTIIDSVLRKRIEIAWAIYWRNISKKWHGIWVVWLIIAQLHMNTGIQSKLNLGKVVIPCPNMTDTYCSQGSLDYNVLYTTIFAELNE